MPDILTDLSPASLAAAIKANLYTFFHSLRASSQAAVQDSPAGFCWHTAVAHPWFNGVLSAQPPGNAADQAVRDTLAYFQSQGVAGFTWWLAPHLDPAAWSTHLLRHGFIYEDDTPGMAIDLDALPPPARRRLTIQCVEDQWTLAVWTHTFIHGYGVPEAMAPAFMALIESLGTALPFRNYLGLLNDQPVATATLFLGAGVAGIYNVATSEEVRGQGIGSAMTLAPLMEGGSIRPPPGKLACSSP